MTMKLLFFFLTFTFLSHSQILLNDSKQLNDDNIVFNPEFIKARQIRLLKGRISVKKPGSVIKTTNQYRAYFFDSLGRIESSYETVQYSDTLWREYYYNGKGYLIYQSYGTTNKYKYYSYLYDENGRLVAIEEFQRVNDYMGVPKTNLEKTRKFEYLNCDTVCVKIISTENGTPFMKEIMTPLLNGNPKRIEKRYLATNEGTIETFEYGPYGQILVRNTVTSKQKLAKEKLTFQYDELGNVKERKYFEQGVLTRETQYIVNEKTGLLSALIEEKELKGYLTIIRFGTYEYY